MLPKRPHLLVTGASSGIGAAIVQLAIAQGWQVSGLARREERLQQLSQELGDQATYFAYYVANVTASSEIEAAVQAAVAKHGRLQAVVANAGRGVDGEILDLSPEDVAAVYDLNVVGVHRTLLATVPELCQPSAFVAISSVAAFLPIPRMGAYCATKHALEAWAAAARMELATKGIAVMTCCPGTVSTDFFAVAPKPGKVWDWRPGSAPTPKQVAKVVLRQIKRRRPRRRMIPWFARWSANLHRLCPWLGEAIMRRALKAMRDKE